MTGEPLLAADGLSLDFASGARRVAALRDVGFTLSRGETLGLVGPSGSGKSTLARVVMRLLEPDRGTLLLEGHDLLKLQGSGLRRMRRRWSMVFQDPLAAFNPRATVASAVDDPLRIHGFGTATVRRRRVAELLDNVGLSADLAARAVHEISGGQRQRVAIARAIATQPALVVLDEAVSALDVIVRRRLLDLLVALQRDTGVAYLFISHDLGVVRAVSHRIAVMDAGRIMETGPAASLIAAPRSATAKALVAAVPSIRPAEGAKP
ncbi:ABC transporter ATP-binding protein [Aureimonas leprariae]|uniref:Glutathione import ATP-binding protein GsiA n=1 Tax=Plantimonas leprariae TaxID=2615207 RepID=A0A7V7TW23_9HYPH|nr:ATP-binding cassette domain-containing protein [Aureimonas leprariae]KAB0679117.1 ABC transporter ATP-binding protein [Aureimonas leprariae]